MNGPKLLLCGRGIHKCAHSDGGPWCRLPVLVTLRIACLAQAEGQEQLEAVKRKLEQMLALAANH